MSGNERREAIWRLLQQSSTVINASTLATRFGVTRQIIVSDIALLRANGRPIAAERRGYYIEKTNGIFETILCNHTAAQTLDEFYAILEYGGKILNVIVEHPIYGQISADLNIASRFDAREFIEKTKESNAMLLCHLTGGVHMHTILVPSKEAYRKICNTLQEQHILNEIKEDEPGTFQA